MESPNSTPSTLTPLSAATRAPSDASSSDLADLLQQYQPLLFRLAVRLTKSESDADDLVQDTLERALRKATHVDSSKLRAWLITVLNNLFIDECRLRRRRPCVQLDIAILPAPTSVETKTDLWQEFDAAALRCAVEQLPHEFAEVYRLHAFEKQNYLQIATALGIARATVGTRLLRARKRLKKILHTQLELGRGPRLVRASEGISAEASNNFSDKISRESGS